MTHAPILCTLFLSILGGVSFSRSHAATLVVSPSGDDQATGSTSAPFRTISRAAQMAMPAAHIPLPLGSS